MAFEVHSGIREAPRFKRGRFWLLISYNLTGIVMAAENGVQSPHFELLPSQKYISFNFCLNESL
jgi:hypothetical protein